MLLWNLLFLAIQVIPICLFSFHPWIIDLFLKLLVERYLAMNRYIGKIVYPTKGKGLISVCC